MENKEIENTNNEPTIIDIPSRPEESDYIICYVDMLGSKALISQTELFDTIYDAFTFAVNIASKLKIFEQLEFKVFSDNILIAKKVENPIDKDEVYRAYNKMVIFLKHFLSSLLTKGLLFRGGITLNKLAINEIMVWGDGLVEVVKIEEQVCIYPRIVMSSKLLEVLSKYELEKERFEEQFSCLYDTDGCVFIDYIDYYELPTALKTLKKSYKIITQKIENESDLKILQKYNWHKNYLNRAKDIYNEYYDFEQLEWDE